MYKERTYRDWMKACDLVLFRAVEKETDLAIMAGRDLEPQARASILTHRAEIEGYIGSHPEFYASLEPLRVEELAPGIVAAMAAAAAAAGVGPMAAVAGAMAEFVGRDLLALSPQVIVENGGDIFMRSAKPRRIGIYAGSGSPFAGKLAIEIPPSENGLGVCTSSGTVSHSLSFGRADAALIVAENAALADAAATAVGNRLKKSDDIRPAIEAARKIAGIAGILVIIGNEMGSWGNIKLV